MMIRALFFAILCASTAVAQGLPSSPYSTAFLVNGVSVSHYDIEQATLMNQALTDDKNPRAEAEKMLINDILYLQEADRLDISVSEKEVRDGMAEYAGRSGQTDEEFLRLLGRSGVHPGTFRNFVRAGLAWRKVIARLYGEQASDISGSEVDDLVEYQPAQGVEQFDISEIALPATPELSARANEVAQQIIAYSTSASRFAEAAKRASVANSGPSGGKVGWMSLSRLPPTIHGTLRNTSTGSVSAPQQIDQHLYIFFVHNRREVTENVRPAVIEYAMLTVTGENPEAAAGAAGSIARRVSSCSDLGIEAQEWAEEDYRKYVVASNSEEYAQIPVETARLDNGEVAIRQDVPGRPNARLLIMLCDRIFVQDREVRTELRRRLLLANLEAYSSRHLATLKANSVIIRK